MILKKTLMMASALLALVACDVEQAAVVEAPAAVEAPVATPAAPASETSSELAAAAQIIANDFDSRSGQNLGRGGIFDGAYAEGNRVVIEYQVPVAGRLYRNFDRADDPLRRSISRANCANDTISAFLLLGGVMEVIVKGRDNVRIGVFVFDRPCP